MYKVSPFCGRPILFILYNKTCKRVIIIKNKVWVQPRIAWIIGVVVVIALLLILFGSLIKSQYQKDKYQPKNKVKEYYGDNCQIGDWYKSICFSSELTKDGTQTLCICEGYKISDNKIFPIYESDGTTPITYPINTLFKTSCNIISNNVKIIIKGDPDYWLYSYLKCTSLGGCNVYFLGYTGTSYYPNAIEIQLYNDFGDLVCFSYIWV